MSSMDWSAACGRRAGSSVWQLKRNGRFEIELIRKAAFRKLGYERCLDDYFGERRDVVHRTRINGGRVGGIAQISEGMHHNFSAIANSNGGTREGFVRDGAFDHLKRGLELGLATRVHGLERHGIFRQLATDVQFHVDAGNGYGQMSAHGNLAKERAGGRDLRHVADAERG